MALAVDASHANVHYNLGTSLLASGKVEAAIDSFRAALAREPQLAAASNNLGVAYRRLGRLTEARAAFASAIAADPAYADAHSNLGSALQAEGRLKEAVASFTRALQLRNSFTLIQGFCHGLVHAEREALSLKLSPMERTRLQTWASAPGTPQQVALRCWIVLAAVAGEDNVAIVHEHGSQSANSSVVA